MQRLRRGPATQLAGKACISLALRRSSLYVRGDGLFGALGTGKFDELPRFTKIDLDDAAPHKVEAGWGHSVVVSKTGQVYMSGRPYDFQTLLRLNNINTAASSMARLASKMSSLFGAESGVYPSFVQLALDEPVVDVACSAGLTVMCTESGAALCMGANRWGQCGIPQAQGNHVYSPRIVQGLQGESVVKVAAGLQHSVCCTSDGNVFTWGKGERGQLGHGVADNSHAPVFVQLPEKVQSVAAGLNHTAALTESGKVFVWGKQMSTRLKGKQMVNELYEDQLEPRLLEVPGGAKVLSVVCSNFHTALHTDDGKLYVMGLSEESRSVIPQPLEIVELGSLPEEGGVAMLKRGFNRVLVVSARGKAYEVMVANDAGFLEPLDMPFAGESDPLQEERMLIADVAVGWKHSLLVLQESLSSQSAARS